MQDDTNRILRVANEEDLSSLFCLPSFDEAVEMAKMFDRYVEREGSLKLQLLEADPIDFHARKEALREANLPPRQGKSWALDDYRADNYYKWALWIIHCLAFSDLGKKYGNLIGIYHYHKNYADMGLFPLTTLTCRYFQFSEHWMSDKKDHLLKRCPGCSGLKCTLQSRADPRELLKYKTQQNPPNEETQNDELGPKLRYQAYRFYAKSKAFTARRRIYGCVVFWIRMTYPGYPLRGYEEVSLDEGEGEDEYAYAEYESPGGSGSDDDQSSARGDYD